ncbi:MAG: hypothetical protein RM049_29995 [Nostoc sp. DedQUE04]|nr:hypothetical protein [Nostoc sp. DedQUE04]MDZ8139473.1 hypothetical protein [Nostoc sp. DedQUE04]
MTTLELSNDRILAGECESVFYPVCIGDKRGLLFRHPLRLKHQQVSNII